MNQCMTVARVSAAFRHNKKYVWSIAWSVASVCWSIVFIKGQMPEGGFLFLGFLFLSVYGWVKWFHEDIEKLVTPAKSKRDRAENLKEIAHVDQRRSRVNLDMLR